MYAKEGIRNRDQPVGQRGFLNVRNAIQARNDPIMRLKDIAPKLPVRGINVIHQSRRRNDAPQKNGRSNDQNINLPVRRNEEMILSRAPLLFILQYLS